MKKRFILKNTFNKEYVDPDSSNVINSKLTTFCFGLFIVLLALVSFLAYIYECYLLVIDGNFFHKGCRKYTSVPITVPLPPILVNSRDECDRIALKKIEILWI